MVTKNKKTPLSELIEELHDLQKRFLDIRTYTDENKEEEMKTLYRRICDAFHEIPTVIDYAKGTDRAESAELTEDEYSVLSPYYCYKCEGIHPNPSPSESDSKKTRLQEEKAIYMNHFPYADAFPVYPEPHIPHLRSSQIYHMDIVGVYYTGNGEYMESLSRGTVLSLEAEPDNEYDSTAVSVWHKSRMLGYLPGEENEEIFDVLENDDEDAEVIALFGSYSPSEVVEFDIQYNMDEIRTLDDLKDAMGQSNEFYPERGHITIEVRYLKTMKRNFQHIMDILRMVKNLHSVPLIEPVKKMGRYGLKLLEKEIEKTQTDDSRNRKDDSEYLSLVKHMLSEISNEFKAKLGKFHIYL